MKWIVHHSVSHSIFRWLCHFSSVIQPFLLVLFIWGLITICAAFLSIHMLVVECFFYSFFFSGTFLFVKSLIQWNFIRVIFFCPHTVESWREFGRAFDYITSSRLFLRRFVRRLRAIPTSAHRIWWMRRNVRPFRMVFVPGWRSTNTTNRHHFYTSTDWHQVLWQHEMWSRNIQICSSHEKPLAIPSNEHSN